jgi:hypothetical protein
MKEALFHVLATGENASESNNGVKFHRTPKGMHTVEPITKALAVTFFGVPGFKVMDEDGKLLDGQHDPEPAPAPETQVEAAPAAAAAPPAPAPTPVPVPEAPAPTADLVGIAHAGAMSKAIASVVDG